MNTTLLEQGVELMLVGMGTVFVFLTTLVAATALMSRIVGRFASDAQQQEPGAEEIAAITGAIAMYRRDTADKDRDSS